MKSNCLNCGIEISYFPSQAHGKYCSNRCQADHKLKEKFKKGTRWNNAMSRFIKRMKGENCEVCGITEWNGKPITLHIDHIDGNRTNNEFDNLMVICPNCHSQTDTFGHKNVSESGKIKMIESVNNNRNKGLIAQ